MNFSGADFITMMSRVSTEGPTVAIGANILTVIEVGLEGFVDVGGTAG